MYSGKSEMKLLEAPQRHMTISYKRMSPEKER